ncbi:ABC transporter ATP-binding protein [Egibacter rhizosphaerae]|uniref:ABC transporter ATP-binding protein n=1 Tax=Egibacter rhizosphaerae TaxID=1670831 RepID=A0A411YF31_9ACTN|nr:ABC transporter ATP-binding protein [Egibacter rhizosphaerae]QBI19828.1 ABC transporter ATP-binding protein [Egibacter rhizosphaerae]
MSAPSGRAAADGDATVRDVLRIGAAIARFRPGLFWGALALWVGFWVLPLAFGLGLRWLVDTIAAGAPLRSLVGIGGLVLAAEATRIVVFGGALRTWIRWWVISQTQMRANLLDGQLAREPDRRARPVEDPAAAVTVFRDDVDDATIFVDTWMDAAGVVVFAVAALAIMAGIDPLVAAVVLVPVAVSFALNNALATWLRRWRRADREATEGVTGFLGDAFASVLTIKTAGAERAVVDRLAVRNARRRTTALRDRLLEDALRGANTASVPVTIGLVLLVAAGGLRDEVLSVGDLTLVASYATTLVALPLFAGLLVSRGRHLQVAANRLARLLPGDDPHRAVAPRDERVEALTRVIDQPGETPIRNDPPGAPAGPVAVEVRGLAALHRDGTPGIAGVDLDLPAGTVTVVTGPVGAGKTTFLRALLGLLPTEGEVRWDGEPIADLAAHMVPPNAAYVAQVPRLFTEPLRDNLRLGRDLDDEELHAAAERAQIAAEVAAMPDGLDTVVGSRGVRLSGGQVQRAATARALAHRPRLLVVDDLSSAVDVETEQALWKALREDGSSTVLAVSHRAVARRHADRVVRLEGGRLRELD